MVKINRNVFSERGASVLEVLLAVAVIAVATPFLYNQMSNANDTVRDIAMAQNIINIRDDVLNFVRANQDSWPDVAQIKLSDEELDEISQVPTAGFIDKYQLVGASATDVYLVFDLDYDSVRTARIARNIGADAAIVSSDGVAYGDGWAASAPDFKAGNLIYRISRDVTGEDKSKFLHRGGDLEDGLNIMARNLNMGGHNVFNVGGVFADSVRARNVNVVFLDAENVNAKTIYFSDGANMDGANVEVRNLRITGDMIGFRNIYADSMNGKKFTTQGKIITDRATIENTVNVANNLVLKSDVSRTISGFAGISANSIDTSLLKTEEIIFYDTFGLTVSAELLYSTTPAMRIGSWSFPSITPPRFSEIYFDRAQIPSPPSKNEFMVITSSVWQSAQPRTPINAQ